MSIEMKFASKGLTINVRDSATGAPVILYKERKKRLCPTSHSSPHAVMDIVNAGEIFNEFNEYVFWAQTTLRDNACHAVRTNVVFKCTTVRMKLGP